MTHGVRARYNAGCRCLECMAANNEGRWRDARRNPNDRIERGFDNLSVRDPAPLHGTRSRYVKGCRCDLCREAERLYKQYRRGNPSQLRTLCWCGSVYIMVPKQMVEAGETRECGEGCFARYQADGVGEPKKGRKSKRVLARRGTGG